jgi:hypothetical protein
LRSATNGVALDDVLTDEAALSGKRDHQFCMRQLAATGFALLNRR